MTSLQNIDVSAKQQALASQKASVEITVSGGTGHAVVTFNDPMPVQSGSATLTGTMVMDMVITGQTVSEDAQVDLTASYVQATLLCQDGTHTVHGSLNISGPMELDTHVVGTTATVTGSWTWTLTSDSLTVDGVAYNINLVYSGTITFPGTLDATLVGTINGVAVNESISVTVTY